MADLFPDQAQMKIYGFMNHVIPFFLTKLHQKTFRWIELLLDVFGSNRPGSIWPTVDVMSSSFDVLPILNNFHLNIFRYRTSKKVFTKPISFWPLPHFIFGSIFLVKFYRVHSRILKTFLLRRIWSRWNKHVLFARKNASQPRTSAFKHLKI